MTDQDLQNLTGEDLKLITKIAYRISKKGTRQIFNIVIGKIIELNKQPNGFHQLNSKYNSDSRSHKNHIPDVKMGNQNKKIIEEMMQTQFKHIGILKNDNVRKFFHNLNQEIKKTSSDSFKLNCPDKIMIDKKFQIHAFQSETQKLVNPKLKYNQDQLKNPQSQEMYKFRQQVLKQLQHTNLNQKAQTQTTINKNVKQPNQSTPTINKSQSLFSGMKTSVLFSSGFSAIVNIQQLTNGNYLQYFARVGVDTGLGAGQCVLTNSLKSLGKSGGIISTLVIGSVLNVYNLMNNGDWARFGLSTGATASSVAVGYGGAEGGAIIGTMICPGIGTTIGGIVGGFVGGFIGGWAFNKFSGSSQMTKKQKQNVLKAQQQELKKIAKNMNKQLSQFGQKVSENGKLESQLTNGNIQIHQKSIDQIYKIDKSYLTPKMVPFYLQVIRPIVMMAKALSPTGNVSQGLRILIQMTDKYQ